MIVVNPDEILWRQHRRQSARKHPIDAQIAEEIIPRKLDERAAKMEQGPEYAIGVVDIIFVKILAGEIKGRKSQSPIGDDTGLGLRRVLNLAAPAEPDAPTLLQSGPYRDCQSSRVGSCAGGLVYSIGNHHQSPVRRVPTDGYRVCQPWFSGCVDPTG